MESVNAISDGGALASGTLNGQDISSIDPDEVTPGCFEFRLRTRSFDMHQLAHGNKLKKFGRLFRTTSDSGVRQPQPSSLPSSPRVGASPHHSPPRRRRFVRVVRDKPEDCTEDGRYVVHRYSQAFLAQMNRERHSSESDYSSDRPLPYEVTGHTILKRPVLAHSQSINSNSSAAGDGESTPPVFKHASFRNEVVVIEFNQKCKVREAPATHVIQLHDAFIDDYDSHAACQRFEDYAANETIAAMTKDILSSDDTDESEASRSSSLSDGCCEVVAEQSVVVQAVTVASVGDC